jgi:hypothetical protein
MTEVCKYQSVCKEFEGRDRRASSANATAWIVNWCCVVMLFAGMVVMSHSIDVLQADAIKAWSEAREERRLVKAEVSVLAAALKVSTKDVLPHVLKIEEMLLTRRCGEVAGN